MSYRAWFNSHGKKHSEIVNRLVDKGFTKGQIIDYFDFENMVQSEPDFCPLYAESKKCHDVKQLNCYLCACPLFRFNSDGIATSGETTTYSYCHVNSKLGEAGQFDNAIHQDCTNCSVPHGKKYVSTNYDTDWFRVMNACDLDDS